MDYIVKKASALTTEEQDDKGLTGIPQEWPVEIYKYTEQDIPAGFTVMADTDITELKNNNQASYDAWIANLHPVLPPPAPPAPIEVVTQFERRDKVVKLASAGADVDANSMATILIKIPGTPNSGAGRWIDGGTAWFDEQHKDDRIMSVEFTDEDNLLGYGAGTVVGTYTDTELDSAQQGWRIPNKRGMIEVIAMGGYGFAPAGFYMKITGKKGGGLTTGTLYMNVMWGKVE